MRPVGLQAVSTAFLDSWNAVEAQCVRRGYRTPHARTHGSLPVDCMRRRVWSNERVLWWYAQNMILFVKQSHIQENLQLKAEYERAEGMPLSVVHPEGIS